MRTRIQQRAYNKWPGNIRRRLMALTVREESGMRGCVKSDMVKTTFVLFENDTPVAWAITCGYDDERNADIMIYVRRDKRYLGYGRRLFTQAKRWTSKRKMKYFVYPDGINNGFWKKIGVKI